MSANVWFEQVEKGLIQEIKNTVRVKDSGGVLVALEDNSIIVRKPEKDFQIEVFPCVSIYNIDYKFDSFRYSPEPIVVSKDPTTNKAVMEESATPFKLNYQIDFWGKYMEEEMNPMTMTWMKKHFRQFNLDVVDDGGHARSCNCMMIGSPKKSDLVLNGERLFHTIISYSIWVELDDETRYNVGIVTDSKLNINAE